MSNDSSYSYMSVVLFEFRTHFETKSDFNFIVMNLKNNSSIFIAKNPILSVECKMESSNQLTQNNNKIIHN